MNLQDFYYELPENLIAQYPSERRTDSRLMVLYRNNDKIEHYRFTDLVNFLSKDDLIVFNNTKVIKAKLNGRRKTGGRLECVVFQDFPNKEIHALVKGHPKDGEIVELEGKEVKLSHIREGIFKVEPMDTTVEELISRHGKMPLPPYIKREPDERDLDRYQTIFGQVEGAVAAPTASLHFDNALVERIKKKGIETVSITLHVGIGTFLPVKSVNVEEHAMMPEYYEISASSATQINNAKEKGRKIIFCGTTTVRAIEASSINGKVRHGSSKAEIFIYPGYKFQIVERMLTNFHLPKATPLFLVSALVGREKLLNAYKIAIKEKYRFFSYGDAMLII